MEEYSPLHQKFSNHNSVASIFALFLMVGIFILVALSRPVSGPVSPVSKSGEVASAQDYREESSRLPQQEDYIQEPTSDTLATTTTDTANDTDASGTSDTENATDASGTSDIANTTDASGASDIANTTDPRSDDENNSTINENSFDSSATFAPASSTTTPDYSLAKGFSENILKENYMVYASRLVDQIIDENNYSRQILLFFYAEWNPQSRLLNNSLIENNLDLPSNLTVFRVPIDVELELKREYNIESPNSFVLLNGYGTIISSFEATNFDDLLLQVKP